MDFGDKLKQYRVKEGLSQEQLAEKIGVSRQAITKWETKRGLPDVENMIILAELFKLTMLNEVTNGFFSVFDYKALILFAVLTVCVLKFKKIHPIVFIALGAVCGIIFQM